MPGVRCGISGTTLAIFLCCFALVWVAQVTDPSEGLMVPIRIMGLKSFSFDEMALVRSNFSEFTQIGRGGYGTVYRGILVDKTVVAIKRAQEESLQGQEEFFTEIKLLSRLHHRNLVFLLGYCHEECEQDTEMLRGKVCLLGYVFAVSFVIAASQTTDPSEVTALRAIRSTFIDPYENLKSWNKGDPCTSNWIGILCLGKAGPDGYMHVQILELLSLNLSGILAPEFGKLSQIEVLDLMWNHITGSIPKEIGNLVSLRLLLLNGNKLSGSLPDEIGYLANIQRLQVDLNQISGPIPKSFANLTSMGHLGMANNSLTGQIPPELFKLPNILHMFLDSNNLTGYLPPEFSETSSLRILQLDNNNFVGGEVPASYGSTKLLKLSLRNCSLRGSVPDLSGTPHLYYLDLSWNQLSGSIPSSKLSDNLTTIDISNNNLNGSIPTSFSELPYLQKLLLENNFLSGSIPTVWQNMSFSASAELILDFRNNSLSTITEGLKPPRNVTLRLQGNPVCDSANSNIVPFCGSVAGGVDKRANITVTSPNCAIRECPSDYSFKYAPVSTGRCFCAALLNIDYQLKSPSFSYFPPYESSFIEYMAENLKLEPFQISIYSYGWKNGPRLWMNLTIYLLFDNRSIQINESEVRAIRNIFTTWAFPSSDLLGPYDLLNYPELHSRDSSKVAISKGALAGILLGAIAGTVTVTAIISILITRRLYKHKYLVLRKQPSPKVSIKTDGVKDFSFKELILATNSFHSSGEVGQGGYGKVYKGILANKTTVAVKRAQVGSFQGEREFLTEIELLSRLHHRNLVGLVGYCDEQGEQMLIYEFMPNGSLRDWISVKSKESLNFSTRLRIALGSAKGILYLHTEADPPIFHRDIKASNILLDSKFTAKVADFGLSRLAPVPNDEGVLPGHVSTVVKGTPGYLDPEYFLTHKMTDKSDVYSLGVVFMELLTGMPPISSGKNVVREVNSAYNSGTLFSIIDSKMGSYPAECLAEFISLAIKCCKDNPQDRPSMLEIVRDLEKMLSTIQESSNTSIESESDYSRKPTLAASSSASYGMISYSDIYGR